MNLCQLLRLTNKKIKELEQFVSDAASDMTLEDITRYITFDPKEYVKNHPYLEDHPQISGIHLELLGRNYRVSIFSDYVLLMGICGIEIRRFEGDGVKEYFNELSGHVAEELRKRKT